MDKTTPATTQHTPGPWRIGLTANKGDVWKGWRETDINGPEGCFLSLVQYHAADEADANARLIAAAPRMLEFTQRAELLFAEMSLGEMPDRGIIEEWLTAARAILRDVEG